MSATEHSATHKLNAELLLKHSHLTTERGLRDMRPLSGARKVTLARNRQEIAQPP